MQTIIKLNNEFTAGKISKQFGLQSFEINAILCKLNFIEKVTVGTGYTLTAKGLNKGGEQITDNVKAISSVKWPESILFNQELIEQISQHKGLKSKAPEPGNLAKEVNFREKFKAEFRSSDGHNVRSKAEMLIDDWFFNNGIVHAYEKRLPVEEELYCDFYLPNGRNGIFIEYWGYESDPKYLKRKERKLEIYKKYNFNLIELSDKEIKNLDHVLPKLLLQYGIQTF